MDFVRTPAFRQIEDNAYKYPRVYRFKEMSRNQEYASTSPPLPQVMDK